MSRIFKAKYFPNGDFLGASIGHNPCYCWGSLWSSQAILKEGARWCIGDGQHIDVLDSLWLRGEAPCINRIHAVEGGGELEGERFVGSGLEGVE